MVHESEECLKCEEHKAWEERMKALDRIPGIINWMNAVKGGLAVILFLFPTVCAVFVADRNDLHQKLKEQEVDIAHRQERMNDQVSAIRGDAEAIRMNVAVLVESNKLKTQEIEKALAEIKMARR